MLESIFPMTELLKIRAVDVDAEADFGSVRYAVRGEGEDTFVVDPVEGHLMVSETLNLKSLSRNQRPFMKYPCFQRKPVLNVLADLLNSRPT